MKKHNQTSTGAMLEHTEDSAARLEDVKAVWRSRLGRLTVKTPDSGLNTMLNHWLPYQTTSSRIWARAGFYQASGAIGFRDQLQDMLLLVDTQPQEVRNHLLEAAAHQFREGDVQHWWHPPRSGVRTRLSDDKLFLPYITSIYVKRTGDKSVLRAARPYLVAEPLRSDEEDRYAVPDVSADEATLHEHCVTALRSVALGEHGLPLIGGGDWNDAMNHIGRHGRGESVWLGFFYVAVLREFAPLALGGERDELLGIAGSVAQSLEEHAWDGEWYKRASFDDGMFIGSKDNAECQIDTIAQSWAAIAGASVERADRGVSRAMERLYDPATGILKLLDPPFDGVYSPGYIGGYIPGVRENGGQYTHGAAWASLALLTLGRTEEAWRVYMGLMPYNHSLNRDEALRYRVEPYVVAADIYTNPTQYGRGGWTWYTGAAAWLYHIGITKLLGFDRQGACVRLYNLAAGKYGGIAPDAWESYEIVYRFGASTYHLQARRGAKGVTLDGVKARTSDGFVEMVDDGRSHLVVYGMG